MASNCPCAGDVSSSVVVDCNAPFKYTFCKPLDIFAAIIFIPLLEEFSNNGGVVISKSNPAFCELAYAALNLVVSK